MKTPINLGNRRELFVDDFLIDTMAGTRLQLTHPERREVVFTGDVPWEDQHAFPLDVIQDGEVVRMHYRASIPDLKDESVSITAMLESRDGGRTFARPDLGLVEFNGSQHNNIIYSGGFPGVPEMFIDTNPNCPPHQRFKGFANRYQQLMPMASADGLRWKPLLDAPLPMPGQFDTINTAFWDTEAGCYRSYTRRWCDPDREWAVRDVDLKNFDGDNWTRCIQHATSPDFIHWSEPELLHYADGNRYRVQLYTNAILPCPGAEHICLGFPNRFIVEGVGSGQLYLRNDALFMASRDGLHWNRWLDAWVRPGLDEMNWTHRNNYPVWGIIQTSPTEWSMFITEHYAHAPHPTRVRRLSIRPWGFVSVHGDYSGGEMVTKPFTFTGSTLRINASTAAAGFIKVEVQDEQGRALPGFTLDDMSPSHRTPWYGDELDAVMEWKNGSDLSALAGRPVRLRFVMKDADLYAMRFQ